MGLLFSTDRWRWIWLYHWKFLSVKLTNVYNYTNFVLFVLTGDSMVRHHIWHKSVMLGKFSKPLYTLKCSAAPWNHNSFSSDVCFLSQVAWSSSKLLFNLVYLTCMTRWRHSRLRYFRISEYYGNFDAYSHKIIMKKNK